MNYKDWFTGRRRVKEKQTRIETTRKKVCLVEEILTAMMQRNAALDRHNKALLLFSGLDGYDSDIAKEFFSLLKREALAKVKKLLRVAREDETSDQS